MSVEFAVETEVHRTARVLQVASMFDLPVEEKARQQWKVDLPLDDKPWQIGLILGPSGSGKSTLARHVWPEQMASLPEWPPERSILDGFPAQLGINEVTGLLGAVGLGSPPAWVRPFGTLSNGEQFRAQMARLLADRPDLVVVDEFTSVVDRQVAKAVSHTVQKAVRKSERRMVAVTCHYDVEEWLQPDWTLDMLDGTFKWRSVQPRPRFELAVHPCGPGLWPAFSRHHYLSSKLHRAAQCFIGVIAGEPVAFISYLHFPHPRTRNIKMAHRTVVLPDWQGFGIGGQLSDWLGQQLYEEGKRFRYVATHPALISYFSRSPRWRSTATARILTSGSGGKPGRAPHQRQTLSARRLATRSFEYQPPEKKGT